MWPYLEIILNLNYAVCGECLNSDLTTLYLSGSLLIPRASKNVKNGTQSAGNHRHPKSSPVGTSETTRIATFSKEFCEWLSGVIDGDGCLLVSKKGYTSLEITMGSEDIKLLRYIQDKLGGQIKLRSGVKAYRYRLHNKEGMIKLIHCINGNIRNSKRLLQLHRVCLNLNIKIIEPFELDKNNFWFAGFFDADGIIGFYIKNFRPQLSVRVVNKLLQDVKFYQDIFGGAIYFDSSQNGYYQWSIQSRENILKMQEYFKGKCRSHKSQRFFLVNEYYRLLDLKAYKENSIHQKIWNIFTEKWKKLKI